MLSSIALMERQVATLFRLDHTGRLLAINESGTLPAPRLFVGRTPNGNLWRFRHDLPSTLVRELDSILAAEPVVADLRLPPVTLSRLHDALASHAPIERTWMGPAWHFPREITPASDIATIAVSNAALLQPMFPGWAATLTNNQPCTAVVQEGDVAAVCCSARTSSSAAEAGVETLEEFRGRGYATAVVTAWARAVREVGRIPLYSTSWDNHASQSVARRLGLVLYGADLHIT